jgi:NAD(P)-dependent dehydrogenase (short-subunit alcohol dehydrogenase family)
MAEPMEIASMISLAGKSFGRVDVLVNNAGIQHVSPIEEFPVADAVKSTRTTRFRHQRASQFCSVVDFDPYQG